MPKVVKDSKGSYFVDEGGGVYTPVTEDQAAAFLNGGAGAAAEQGLQNLYTGAGSLLGDDPRWQQENQRGRAASEALNLQSPVINAAAQYAPQAAIGLATGGTGAPLSVALPATMAVEGALGAATTPETPIQGAAIGAMVGGAAEAAPWAAQALYGQARNLGGKLPWFKAANAMDEIPDVPGGYRPGERVSPSDAGGPSGGNSLPPDLPPTAPASALTPESAPSAAPSPAMGPVSDAVGDLPLTPAPAAAPKRMAERVTERLDQLPEAAPTNARALEGTMSPEELYDLGFPTTEGQRAILRARSAQELQAGEEIMRRESAAMSDPISGARTRGVIDAQRQGLTNYLARELDVPPGVQLTDPVLAGVFERVGNDMDRIALSMGNVPLDDAIRTRMTGVLEQTTGAHRHQLEQIANEVVAKAERNSGALSGQDWGEMRTKLGKMVDAGMRQGQIGKISDAQELLGVLTDAMEGSLPDAVRAELGKLREQYRIAATLHKPGTRDAVGQLNPVSFYSNWKRGQSKKLTGRDPIGALTNTVVTLTKPRVPDSGTARRLLGNAASLAADFIPGANAARRLIK